MCEPTTILMRDRPAVRVQIGADPDVADTLVDIVNAAYGKRRVNASSMRHRLLARTNRVLHVAFDESGTILGCCSSTLFVPWCGPGCGHWGLLAVDPTHQGRGVASALVAAAEKRLAAAGMSSAQIEYSFREGEELSERLYTWYEGADGLRYSGPRRKKSGFRVCRKHLTRAALDPEGKMPVPTMGGLRLFGTWLFAVLRFVFCGQY